MIPKQLLVWVKCLHGKTRLPVRINGDVSITNIRDLYRSSYILGSKIELKSPDGSWVELDSMRKNQVTQGKVIYLRNGTKIKCTNEHKFMVNKAERTAESIVPGDILDNSQIKLDINKLFPFNYDEGLVVGLFLAEGNIEKSKKNTIRFTLHKNEQHLYRSIEIIVRAYNGKIRQHIYGNTMHVIVTSPIIYGIITDYITGKNAKRKKLKSKILETNYGFVRGIFDGWLAGDGNYDEKAKRWTVGFCDNKELDCNMKMVSNILGYSYRSSRKFVNAFGKRFKAINAHIRTEVSEHFNTKSDYEVIRTINTNLESYEISLRGKHLYLLYDGTISHNSNPLPQFRLIGYRQATELMFWALKNKNTMDNPNFNFGEQEEMTNVFHAPIVSGKERTEHPTQKPLSITKKIIKVHSKENGSVLDPFGGSGTTALACKELGRKCIIIEAEEKYIEIAIDRLRQEYLPL
jgi:hypothetical protein